ncbi:Melanopsin-A Mammalian-like melanopsin [Takifugu flavidus]|uniref:Melanopsin-A Mammalian-like melanopsin n=1 Tax=Takifugu flavidus TaxID=433684 RepID=A0A5C6MD45_9TELE|nr:Melanopsin-A Mammalian-like melanopsin [Takifugu flavidus]
MVGNVLVIYAFCRSRSLRTPSNIFIINLAITDLLMCFTQTPTFFLTSMHKRWIFGKKGKSSELLLGDLRAKLDPISCRTAAVEQVRAFLTTGRKHTAVLTDARPVLRSAAFFLKHTVLLRSFRTLTR